MCIRDSIPAILFQWYGGEREGEVIADVLFGKVNPSGSLCYSIPQSVGHLPIHYNRLPSDKGIYRSPGTINKPGRDYVFSTPEPLWPFGYGLSYSDFTYEKIESVKQDKKNIRVTVSVKNTSGRDGEEVVQLYASYPDSKVERPSKQLRAFRRIPIKAGETRKVTLTVPKEELGYWNEGKQMFVVEPGTVKLLIGASSEDIRLEGKIRL